MADPQAYRPAPGSIPASPGVYRFRDDDRRVVYVGKAKSLRARLNSYFADLTRLHPRTAAMVTAAASVEWTVVATEVEALQLEYTWIKEFTPRFNVQYRDDKSYPELAVTVGERFPRLQVTRGKHRPGVRYFGPYSHAWAIRETLDLLLPIFPARTCSPGVFKQAQRTGRPCLLAHIGRCSAPCVGWVSEEEHRAIVDGFIEFMSGRTDPLVKRLTAEMEQAAEALDFERAARLRDNLAAVRTVMEKQSVVLGDGTDADVIGIAGGPLQAAVQVFHVRAGRIRGQRGWIVDVPAGSEPDEAPDDGSDDGPTVAVADDGDDGRHATADRLGESTLRLIVEDLLLQFYGPRGDDEDGSGVPREILVPTLPEDAPHMTEWLSGLRGSTVRLRVPRRGDKRALAETVRQNALEALTQHRLRRASDLSARSQALADIGEALAMDRAPLRIECIDISHLQGSDVVASLVVFEDGLAKKSDYRRFAITEHPGDDVASIAEVVRRRFARGTAGSREGTDEASEPRIDPASGRPRRFAYPPQLLVVDGGAPQANAAAAALAELGVDDVAVVGLAKRLEELWLPGQDDPVILPRTSEALYLLQRLRDEAHRFAIRYHRAKRSSSMTTSALDGIPGLGPARRQALLQRFGSVAKIRAAGADAIAQVPGIGPQTAAAVVAALRRRNGGAARS